MDVWGLRQAYGNSSPHLLPQLFGAVLLALAVSRQAPFRASPALLVTREAGGHGPYPFFLAVSVGDSQLPFHIIPPPAARDPLFCFSVSQSRCSDSRYIVHRWRKLIFLEQ